MGITVDVLIVGAGPSGSTAATALAKRGHSVAIIDKAVFRRHKTCASWINALAFSRFPYLQRELDNLLIVPSTGSVFTTKLLRVTERTPNESHPDI